MAINLVAETSPKVVERFKHKSVTEGLATAEYEWTGVETVKVMSIDNLPLQKYDRTKTTGSRFGDMTEVGDTVQEMRVKEDWSQNGSIDKGNNTSQLRIKQAHKILKQNIDEVVVPAVDKYRLKTYTENAGTVVTGAKPNASNFLRTILTARTAMKNAGVPEDGRVMFIPSTLYTELLLADQILHSPELLKKAIVNGVSGMIAKFQVVEVADDWLPDGVNFLIVKRGVVCQPKKLETFRVIEEDKDIDGSIVQMRMLHDAFVLETKNKGVYVHKTA